MRCLVSSETKRDRERAPETRSDPYTQQLFMVSENNPENVARPKLMSIAEGDDEDDD
jgi:hypothetical protein